MDWRALPLVDWVMLTGWILWSILWVKVAYLLMSAFAHLWSRVRGLGAEPPQFAEQRYASGEISRDEFERARRDPQTHPSGSGRGYG